MSEIMIRKIQYDEIPSEEWEELAATYNTLCLERLRVDPPLTNSLIQEIKEIEPVIEAEGEDPGALVLDVFPGSILIREECGLCGWKLVQKMLAVIRAESRVETNIPSDSL